MQNHPVEAAALSVKMFCQQHSISRSNFYVMLSEGRAPRTVLIGRKRLIPVAEARSWLEGLLLQQQRAQQSSAVAPVGTAPAGPH
jgi:predicted DNA-binding transcriptional regulator AlpA